MPYLPPRVTEDTRFPAAYGPDLATTLSLIEERWAVSFPEVDYYSLDKRTTVVANANTLSGETGAAKYDPLYNESADPAQTVWKQPHGTAGTVKAADVEVYKTVIRIRAQVQQIEDTTDLKKLGFDQNDKWIGGLILSIPASLLDAAAITCIAGDKIIWDGDEFLVDKPRQTGPYNNTNLRLYLVLACTRRRHGS